jgi:hypothetical protein
MATTEYEFGVETEMNELLRNMLCNCIEQYITGINYDKKKLEYFFDYLQNKYIRYNELFLLIEELTELNNQWDEQCREMLETIVNQINDRIILKEILSHFDQITFNLSDEEVSTRIDSIVSMLDILESYSDNKIYYKKKDYDYNF